MLASHRRALALLVTTSALVACGDDGGTTSASSTSGSGGASSASGTGGASSSTNSGGASVATTGSGGAPTGPCGPIDAPGTYLDPTTGLCWEEPAAAASIAQDAAETYCAGLSLGETGPGSWHLPSVSELRTLMRGCPSTVTGGICGITDSCLSLTCDYDNCYECTADAGPGTDGCYWPTELGGDCHWFWSSSHETENASYVYIAAFDDGSILSVLTGIPANVRARCVRGSL